jgi:hypothetical protein
VNTLYVYRIDLLGHKNISIVDTTLATRVEPDSRQRTSALIVSIEPERSGPLA